MALSARIVTAILLAGAACGLVGQLLFFDARFGQNTLVLALTVAAMAVWLTRLHVIKVTRREALLIGVALISALGIAVNDSRGLDAVNMAMIAVCIGAITEAAWVPAALSTGGRVLAVAGGAVALPFAALFMATETKWSEIQPSARRPKLKGALLGALAAVPVLALFGAILSQADPVFGRLVAIDLNLPIEQMPQRFFLLGFIGLGAAGLYRAMALPSRTASDAVTAPNGKQPLETASFATFFGLINMLFALFMGVQVRYLFGGNDVVLGTQGLTFAEYGRRGFFEIASVTVIYLPMMLLGLNWVSTPDLARRRIANVTCWIGSGLLLLLLASATYRMALYVDAYGLSPLRFYVLAGIVWFGAIIAAFSHHVASRNGHRFVSACLASGLAIGLGINMVRPDYVIAKVNLARAAALDEHMILDSGADAHRAISRWGSSGLREAWEKRLVERTRPDWRSLSVSEVKALNRIASRGLSGSTVASASEQDGRATRDGAYGYR